MRAVWVLVLTCGFGCFGVRAERIACVDSCQARNDHCVMAASRAEDLERCRLSTDACVGSCSSR
ncbi:MAG: hypothetical protein H6722_23095 [Sandaracinus sp.]|nr:hypothetical protein [Sandaracinus sp.]